VIFVLIVVGFSPTDLTDYLMMVT